MKEAKWIEVLVNMFGSCRWEKRILVDITAEGASCVLQTDEKAYIGNKKYGTFFWEEWREIKEPEYVPFDTIEEVKEALFLKLIKKKYGEEFLIYGFDINCILIGGDWVEFGELFEEFTCDGKPCGKLKEETK